MLLSITEKCRMGCSHCMDVATPEGNDMDLKTFEQAIHFFNEYGFLALIITGGEPTENPFCFSFLDYALSHTNNLTHVTLATNGMNISHNSENQSILKSLFDKYGDRLAIQITHVDKYYPIEVDFSEPFFKDEHVVICDKIESMYPQGRAVESGYPSEAKGSKCFNIRSLLKTYADNAGTNEQLRANSLQGVIFKMATLGKFCTPRINWNGDLKLGESRLCPTVATIYDKPEELVDKIYNFRCDKCGLIKKLPLLYRQQVGEV